jgi:hypothetical protein
MNLILKILGWVIGLFSKAPPQEVVQSREAGSETVSAQTSQATAKTEAKMADAEAQAPQTQAEVVQSLKSGDF